MTEQQQDSAMSAESTGRFDYRRWLQAFERRQEEFRAIRARHGPEEWRKLFLEMHRVLSTIKRTPKLMADSEIDRSMRRLQVAVELEDFIFEMRVLAERLGVLAGVSARLSGVSAQMDPIATGSSQPAGGRMRLRL